jgi:biopolymer transport protein ExbD
MPFVDVFSLLTTFLLFSASFITIGILEVQAPFFSSKVTPDEKNERAFEVKMDVADQKLVVTTKFTEEPVDEKVYEFDHNEQGLNDLHDQLYKIRSENPEVDKMTMFTDDEVVYERLVALLDSVKFLKQGEQEIVKPGEDSSESSDAKPEGEEEEAQDLPLYPKVVMGDVILGKE